MDTSLRSSLAAIVGEEGVITDPAQLFAYDCDAYTIEKAMPVAVALPTTTEQVSDICRLAARFDMPVVPRGAGTGLSGGALAVDGGIIISTAKMTGLLDVDIPNRRIVAQAGVVNMYLTKAVKKNGFFFAPDPSSQGACTIGGNVNENSGGPHTLRYGVTVNHVTSVRMVLADGGVVDLGSRAAEAHGYDLVGVTVGSEGTFGIVTEVTCRITRCPIRSAAVLASFGSLHGATQAVTEIIARGLLPAALEMMDRPVLEAVEQAFGYGLAVGAEAALIVEFDGPDDAVWDAAKQAEGISREFGAFAVTTASEDLDRARLWAARKKAIGSLGHLAPSCVTHDGVIPRSKLPEVLQKTGDIARRHGLMPANVFHAGDGNLHPVLLFDDSDPVQVRGVIQAGEEILTVCLEAGGSLTGEHGIGIEKATLMDKMFDADTIDAFRRLRRVFNPDGRCNPGKVFPDARHCYDMKPRGRAVHV